MLLGLSARKQRKISRMNTGKNKPTKSSRTSKIRPENNGYSPPLNDKEVATIPKWRPFWR